MLGRLPTGGLSGGAKTAVGDDVTPWDTQERQMKGLRGPVFSGSMGFSRQEYWSGVPLLSPFVL